MQAVILAVGDELTGGLKVDTNSAALSARLAARGIATVRHETVGDDLASLAVALRRAAGDADVIIVTGGLGPTEDDLTRHALADALGVDLIADARSLERIAGFFAARGRPMSDNNRRQALIPAGAEAIDNDAGTAPGIAARLGAADVFVLPGPPGEMTPMFDRSIAPRLPQAGAIVRRRWHCFGAGESNIAERIADLMVRGRNPQVGTTASGGVITVHVVARSATVADACAAAEADAGEVASRLGTLIFGADGQTLPEVVGAALAAAEQTLATAESCTGGMIGELITGVPGASAWFRGGVVAYSNAAKTDLLGVEPDLIAAHGAVSEPVAAAMAEGARRALGADWSVAVTGVAGPGGGSDDKPVGLVFIAVASAGGAAVHRYSFAGARDAVRRRAALTALNHLRLAVADAQTTRET